MSPEAFLEGEMRIVSDVSATPDAVPAVNDIETGDQVAADVVNGVADALAIEPDTAETLGGVAVDGFVQETETVTAQPAKPKSKGKPDGRKPKSSLDQPKAKGGRGHFKKHLKTQLTQSGKLNAKQPMSAEQKRLRRRKRK